MLNSPLPPNQQDLEGVLRRGPVGCRRPVRCGCRPGHRNLVLVLLAGIPAARARLMNDANSTEQATARFEFLWTIVVAATIVLLLAVIAFTSVHGSTMPSAGVEVIDATSLHRSGEFVEANLGTGVDSRGRHASSTSWRSSTAFRPHCILIPAGVPVTFRATSSDVVHGLQIQGTNINAMAVPGYISTFNATLPVTGERAMPCHEFCGVGHAAMWARVRVVTSQEFQTLLSQKSRVSCD